MGWTAEEAVQLQDTTFEADNNEAEYPTWKADSAAVGWIYTHVKIKK